MRIRGIPTEAEVRPLVAIALCPAGVGFVYLILLILMLIAAPAGGRDTRSGAL